MNTLSVGAKVYYEIDLETGTRTLKRCGASEFMRLLAQAEEEERSAPVGTGTLNEAELRALGETYNPRRMSQEEYERFIAFLVEKNVLSGKETYDIGLGRVTLRPGCFVQGRLAPNLPAGALSIRTLSDANGDALTFVKLKASWCNRDSWSDRITYDALQKVSRILLKIDQYRAHPFS